MAPVAAIVILSFIGSVVALLGGVVFLLKRSWSSWLSAYSIPFAAGVLLTVSLLGILPESLEMLGETALTVVLFSFLGAYLFEEFFCSLHHHESGAYHSQLSTSVPLILLGDTLHNFVDGVAIAATYLIAPGLGVITTISTFLHEVPHEIGDFGILLKAGWDRKSILVVNVLSALSTIVGALFVLFFTQNDAVLGILLGTATGIFLYLSSSDFLPHIHNGEISRRKAVFSLFLGVAVMLTTFMLVPHAPS